MTAVLSEHEAPRRNPHRPAAQEERLRIFAAVRAQNPTSYPEPFAPAASGTCTAPDRVRAELRPAGRPTPHGPIRRTRYSTPVEPAPHSGNRAAHRCRGHLTTTTTYPGARRRGRRDPPHGRTYSNRLLHRLHVLGNPRLPPAYQQCGRDKAGCTLAETGPRPNTGARIGPGSRKLALRPRTRAAAQSSQPERSK